MRRFLFDRPGLRVFCSSIMLVLCHLVAPCPVHAQSAEIRTPEEKREESSLFVTSVEIAGVTADLVVVRYRTLPANRPESYGNFVAIWQSTAIPWNEPPIQRRDIELNGESGSTVIDGLTITDESYIVGYGVGPDRTNIAASALIPAKPLLQYAPPGSIMISLVSPRQDRLTVRYTTLQGYLPLSYGNWLGLWQGYASPYNAPNPMARAPVPTDASEGVVVLDHLALEPGLTYTLIYFTAESRTSAAAMLNFKPEP